MADEEELKATIKVLEAKIADLNRKLEFERNMRAAVRGTVVKITAAGKCTICGEEYPVGASIFHISNVGFAIPGHEECVRKLRGRVPVPASKIEEVKTLKLD